MKLEQTLYCLTITLPVFNGLLIDQFKLNLIYGGEITVLSLQKKCTANGPEIPPDG